MKTICVLDGRIVMSQDGDAIDTMTQNASQFPGAVVSVVSDEEFATRMDAQKPPTDIHDQIESESRLALRSGALYELIDLAMRQFLEWAQQQDPAITEADLITLGGPNYSAGYAKNKVYRDNLLALMAQK